MHNAILPPNPIEELEKNRKLAEYQQLTKKERRFLKRRQREEERLKYNRHKKLKKILRTIVLILIIIGGISILVWFLATKLSIPESEIISKKGIHWHTNLTIDILDQDQDIPTNIGIGATHQPIHTHKSNGVIHLEFSGLVKENDIRIGRFFKIWKKTFNKDCIFDKCNGSEGQIKMFVNDEQNFEFENYIMRDKDKIEIIFD